MIAYKGFHPGLVCRGYQFVMGLNVTEKANCAANGFHCAENPLDCLIYYPQMEISEYYLVDAGGDVDEDEFDSKISCTQLTILRKLTRAEFSFTLWLTWWIILNVNGTAMSKEMREMRTKGSQSSEAPPQSPTVIWAIF